METYNDEILTAGLSWKVRLCYGFGHIFNDICSSMWFTYLLVFFHLVLKFDPVNSGLILFIGQIADALSTSFVGYHSDKDGDFWLCKYGRRKAWHLVGTMCVLLSFPFIFTPCIGCRSAHVTSQIFYYGSFVVIFQFGWAAVQISHLALIPELSPSECLRTQLTAIRYSFTVISNIFIYVITWISLKIGSDADPANQIGPNDAINFQRVVYLGLVIGIATSIVFHIGVKEKSSSINNVRQIRYKSACDYLKDIKFYQVGMIYMSTRIFCNLTQIYIPLYLHETLSRGAESLAIIPLLIYISSLIGSGLVHHSNIIFGRKVAYLLGAVLGFATCVWIRFGDGYMYKTYEIYVVSVFLGFSSSMLLVTSLSITADLIGSDTYAGAFVYGSMSFADKLGNGIAVMLIQYMKCEYCVNYYRDVLAYVCGGFAVIGALAVLSVRKAPQVEVVQTIQNEHSPLLNEQIEDKQSEH